MNISTHTFPLSQLYS